MSVEAELKSWNATERSRAQTRGLLMALSRDGVVHFSPRWISSFAFAFATFGFVPLFQLARQFNAFERFQWSRLSEFADWTRRCATPVEPGETLTKWADRWRKSVGHRWLNLFAVFAIVVLIVLLLRSFPWPTSAPASRLAITGSGIIRGALLSVEALWLLHLFHVTANQWRLNRWLEVLNRALSAARLRAVRVSRRSPTPFSFCSACFALLVLQVVTLWPIAVLVIAATVCLTRREVRESRRIDLQLIERLLEWMDDSGLPVEYDVTALNPDEIAAMIGGHA